MAAVLGAVLLGCGVQPTGVVDAGEPATGLTRGMRLYYVGDGGLRAVPLIDQRVKTLDSVVKMLLQPPPATEGGGLTTLVDIGGFSVTGQGDRVTVALEGPGGMAQHERLGTGQLVCTLARAQSVLEPGVRTDDVQVLLKPSEGAAQGPYRCSEFLDG
ncbi:GerMN domain-containing protein [Streptomyces sp. CA-294286]|uniref:GerMN domain-containing protein n=1 Tax=Streptomyces sp. CA-294286 TaxID=3240070 RepID=UPI003D940EBD